METALGGIRVLELCSMIAGPFCTKIMADMGAEVLKVERPVIGDEARTRGPFPGDNAHPERSGLFFYLNTN
ncbi:MAG: CoA transferase, partial [Dehalococcoidia bacterium]